MDEKVLKWKEREKQEVFSVFYVMSIGKNFPHKKFGFYFSIFWAYFTTKSIPLIQRSLDTHIESHVCTFYWDNLEGEGGGALITPISIGCKLA